MLTLKIKALLQQVIASGLYVDISTWMCSYSTVDAVKSPSVQSVVHIKELVDKDQVTGIFPGNSLCMLLPGSNGGQTRQR